MREIHTKNGSNNATRQLLHDNIHHTVIRQNPKAAAGSSSSHHRTGRKQNTERLISRPANVHDDSTVFNIHAVFADIVLIGLNESAIIFTLKKWDTNHYYSITLMWLLKKYIDFLKPKARELSYNTRESIGIYIYEL